MKKIRDEDTAVVRPCLEKRIADGTTPIIPKDYSVSGITVTDEILKNLEPNEYPTGNYIRLVLRTAEDGTVTSDSNSITTGKDNVIEDCEDYIEIDELGVAYNTVKILLMGDASIYYNDLGGQFADLAKKANQNTVVVCAYGSHSLGSIVDGARVNTAYWYGQDPKIRVVKGSSTIDDVLYEDWGAMDKKGKWDYILVPGDSNSSIKEAFEMMSRCLKDSKNFIIYSDSGNPQSYSDVANDLKCSVLGAGVVFDSYSEQGLLGGTDNPSGVRQYIGACCLFAKIYGKNDLVSFIPLYNAEGGTTKDFYQEVEYHDDGNADKCNVNRERAHAIQDLVVEHYEDGVLAVN